MQRIKVNTREIDYLPDYDSSETLKERIASTFKTIPKWIQSLNMKEIQKNPEVPITLKMIQVLMDTEIKNGNIDLNHFLTEHIIGTDFANDLQTIVQYWITKVLPSRPYLMDPIQEVFDKYDIRQKVEILLDNVDLLRNQLDEKIRFNRKKSENFLIFYKKLLKIKPTSYTSLQLERKDIAIVTNVKKTEMSLQNVFAKMSCSQHIPFISLENKSIYKLYQYIEDIPKEWIDFSIENAIFLKIRNNLDEFTDCYITFSELNEERLIFETRIVKNVDVEMIKNRILTCLNMDDNVIIDEYDTSVTGISIFPLRSFNKVIMSDMIMNNELFSTFLAVDESDQPSKEKSGLYTHFFIGNHEGTCSIISKIAKRTDQDIKLINRKDLPYGSSFIRLRINRVKNLEIANKFLTLFAKLIVLYDTESDDVIDLYKSYGINVDIEEVHDVQQTFSLQENVPEVFVSGYSRTCSSWKMPKMIEEEDIKQYQPSQVMIFPKDPKEGLQHYYACDNNNEYIHIGVRVNQLSNRDQFPYVPCCFTVDQKKKKVSHLKDYLDGKMPGKYGKQQNILKTEKFARNNDLAFLPDNLSKLFKQLEPSKSELYEYYRKGIQYPKLSFLECILKALNKPENVADELEKMIKYPYISVASQENPGLSEDEIRQELSDIKSKNMYMDPKKWVRLCEVYYGCQIILFSKQKFEEDAVLEIPYHQLVYLQYDYLKKTKRGQKPIETILFIYEHYGSESDQSDEPRCELIIAKRMNVKEDYDYFLRSMTTFPSFYQNVLRQYYYNQNNRQLSKIPLFVLPLSFQNIQSQSIDQYGKVRSLIVDDITLLTTPLPPLPVESFPHNQIYQPTTFTKAKNFITAHDCQILSYSEHELTFTSNSNLFIIFTIQCSDINKYKSQIDHKIKYTTDKYPYILKENHIDSYFKMKRLALFITEYFIYYYSYRCHEKQSEQLKSTESLKEFMKDVIILKNPQYQIAKTPELSIQILKQSGFLNHSNQFIVDSFETKKRLLYQLRLRLSHSYLKVKNYYSQREMEHFYDDEQHYNLNTTDTIIITDLSQFQPFINNHIYSEIQPSLKQYFIKNKNIENDAICLAENCDENDENQIKYTPI